MKRILSVLVISAIIFAQFGSFTLIASAETTDDLEFITIQTDEPSEYGYVNYRYVDQDGNEVDINQTDVTTPKRVTVYSNSSTSIPSSYDSRSKNYITNAKYQGNSGNCWVFSTMSALETDSIINGLDDINSADYSEAHFAWFAVNSSTPNANDPTYGDGVTHSNPYMVGGNWQMATAALARWAGVADDKDYPSTFNDLSSMGNYDESERYNTDSGVVIKSAEVLTTTSDVKNWIMEHGSVTVAYLHNDSYLNSTSDSTAYYYNLGTEVNHQVAVVGWDDNYSASNFKPGRRPAYNGAWLCKNSWSAYWGDDGYFWISYYDTSLCDFTGYTTQSADKYNNNYTYNGAGYKHLMPCTQTTQVSNVFTAKSHETLSAISTYTSNENQVLEISIYKDLPSNYTRPNQGTLAVSWTTTVPNGGYHTIELPEEVALDSGSKFSVAIKYVYESGTLYIPYEYNTEKAAIFSRNAGESFFSISSSASIKSWTDTYKKYGDLKIQNFCIQAFTKCNHQHSTSTTAATCMNEGRSITTCSQCGKLISEETLPKTNHEFGEWSDYILDSHSNRYVRKRYCIHCNTYESQTKAASSGGRTVTLDEFFEILFENIFGSIFSRMRENLSKMFS